MLVSMIRPLVAGAVRVCNLYYRVVAAIFSAWAFVIVAVSTELLALASLEFDWRQGLAFKPQHTQAEPVGAADLHSVVELQEQLLQALEQVEIMQQQLSASCIMQGCHHVAPCVLNTPMKQDSTNLWRRLSTPDQDKHWPDAACSSSCASSTYGSSADGCAMLHVHGLCMAHCRTACCPAALQGCSRQLVPTTCCCRHQGCSVLSRKTSSSGSQWVPAIDAVELQQQDQYAALLARAPEEFLCPMSLLLLTDPVVTPTGITYNRPAVEHWIEQHNSDPATGVPLIAEQLYPNLVMRDRMARWLQQQGCHT